LFTFLVIESRVVQSLFASFFQVLVTVSSNLRRNLYIVANRLAQIIHVCPTFPNNFYLIIYLQIVLVDDYLVHSSV
jgi:hypothetical protein